MTTTLRRLKGLCIGALSGANGHAIFLRNWPEELLTPEAKEEPCTFCASRGLRHGW
jgi:hypothetical protein